CRFKLIKQPGNEGVSFALTQDILDFCAESEPSLGAKFRTKQLLERVTLFSTSAAFQASLTSCTSAEKSAAVAYSPSFNFLRISSSVIPVSGKLPRSLINRLVRKKASIGATGASASSGRSLKLSSCAGVCRVMTASSSSSLTFHFFKIVATRFSQYHVSKASLNSVLSIAPLDVEKAPGLVSVKNWKTVSVEG